MLINTERAVRVAVYSRSQLAELRSATGIQYDQLTSGILHIFRSEQEYRQALPQVEVMDRAGCKRVVVDADECVKIEPALAHVRPHLIGGIFSPDDESGDAHAFTVELARICVDLGVTFHYDTTVRRFVLGDRRLDGVETDTGGLTADAYILAFGSFSPLVLKPLGLKLPVYPAKGYSATIPIGDHDEAPTVSLIDDEFKIVYSRLNDRLRVAGTAEFAGYDDSVTEVRARFILDKAMELFPGCGDAGKAEFWAGLRPSTPDGVPVIGGTPYPNLFLNTGHGTLGWTMACGAGRLLADVIDGKPPEISLDGLGIGRFG
jgi:D-amino-acid dehydrogenase